jgi:hypothetical protein
LADGLKGASETGHAEAKLYRGENKNGYERSHRHMAEASDGGDQRAGAFSNCWRKAIYHSQSGSIEALPHSRVKKGDV